MNTLKVTRIVSPKFKVGYAVLNHEEITQLRFEVMKGEKPANITVTCMHTGFVNTILSNGYFKESFPIESNLHFVSNLDIDMFMYRTNNPITEQV
jgi:hypothetical protein